MSGGVSDGPMALTLKAPPCGALSGASGAQNVVLKDVLKKLHLKGSP